MDTKKKLLSKIDDINKYLEELNTINLTSLEDYENSVAKKRACERLLQILIEAVIDICYLLHKYKSLGVPKDDDLVIEDLYKKKILKVDDELVYENLTENIDDFEKLKNYFLNVI